MRFFKNIFPVLFLFAPLICSASESHYAKSLVEQARLKNLGSTRQWHKLLHYERTLLGYRESQADGASFFFAERGKSDPDAELASTIRALFSPVAAEKDDEHPQCRFPARTRWLREVLSIGSSKLPQVRCEKFRAFADKLEAHSATVVFSSYYLNNPSSAFGHSFLRLNKTASAHSGKRHELLDFGINYAAVVDTGNAVVYAVKGISGMFKGSFTSVPYYYKVREYNDYEARDLWEYDLELTPEQVQLLVAHIWELGGTEFDYYYFTENCSYHVLSVLDVANPELYLLERQARIVIPSDTMKVIAETPGLVRAVHFRPSMRRQFEFRLSKLNEEERGWVEQVIRSKDPSLPETLSPARQALILDAAADYIDFTHNKELVMKEGDAPLWMHRILVARSKLGTPSASLDIPALERDFPDRSHGSARIALRSGLDSERGWTRSLNYRFALHDLLDPIRGYPENAEIEMFGFRLSGDSKSVLRFDELTFSRVVSLSPIRSFQRKPSWSMNIGVKRFDDFSCDSCIGPLLELGGGGAIQMDFVTAFLLGEAGLVASSGFAQSKFQPLVGGRIGFRSVFSDSVIGLLQGSYRHGVLAGAPEVLRAEFGLRWAFSSAMALDLSMTSSSSAREASIGILYYH